VTEDNWLSGSVELARAQQLLRDAIAVELTAARTAVLAGASDKRTGLTSSWAAEPHCVICRHDFRPWHNQRDHQRRPCG
jgi:hypothetical protein